MNTDPTNDAEHGDAGPTSEQIGHALGVRLDSAEETVTREPDPAARTPYVAPVRPVGLPERPAWDVDERLRPARVQQAYAALEGLAARAQEAQDRLESLRHEQDEAEAAYRREAVAAHQAGEPSPTRQPVDWDSERLAREAVNEYCQDEYRQAVVAYRQAVQDALPEWFDNLVAALPQAHDAARAAVPALHQAAEPFLAWRGLLAAAEQARAALHPRDPYPRTGQDAPSPGALSRGIAESVTVLDTDDDVLNGSYLAPSAFDPPMHVRRRMFSSGAGALRELAILEKAEKYAHSALTRGGPYAPTQTTWIKLPNGGVMPVEQPA